MQLLHKRVTKLIFAIFGLISAASFAGETEVLIDGEKGLENFNIVGTGNWSALDGALEATKSEGDSSFLMTKNSYDNFTVTIEFWASEDANSGIYMRCQDGSEPGDQSCYEANIYDTRPDPVYGTGAIVHVAKAPEPPILVGGKWNTYKITLDNDRLKVILNGTQTVDTTDSKLTSGPIGLQWGQGKLRFRKFEITPLN